MYQFPITCIDNFFKYPEEIRRFGLSLKFKSEPQGLWPGTRSPELSSISEHFKDAICRKYLKCFLSSPAVQYKCAAYFQKIEGESNKGWVHNDTPHLHTTLMYLSPNADLNSGTSIYKPKTGVGPMITTRNNVKKREFNLGKLNKEEAEKFRIQSNNDFEETIRFSNVYNRCIGFDSSYWHCANDFSKNKDSRLTLIIFWYEIVSGQSGIQRKDMEII